MKKLIITNIGWEAPEDANLPKKVVINNPSKELLSDHDGYAEEIGEYLSDEYGFLVKFFSPKVVDEPEEILEVKTTAGILRARKSANPGQPGIDITLQPTGYDDVIDVSFISVYEDPEHQTEDKERPEDVSILVYGDATTDDHTDKIMIRREEIVAGLGTAAHL